MKKLIAVWMILAMLLCAVSALADGGEADFQYSGTTYHVTYGGSEIDEEGQLNVKLYGFGEGVPIVNGKIIIIAWVNVVIGGKEIESKTVNINTGEQRYTYIFDTDQMPEEIILYPYEDSKNGILVWKTGDPVPAAAPAEESSAVPAEEGSPAIPEELVGTWKGTGTPKNGGPSIDLSAEINADGTGSYVFEQAGYRESYPFSISNEENTFTVDIPKNNQLSISECGGTWKLEDGKLILDIKTTFANGGSYSYTAECVKEDIDLGGI